MLFQTMLLSITATSLLLGCSQFSEPSDANENIFQHSEVLASSTTIEGETDDEVDLGAKQIKPQVKAPKPPKVATPTPPKVIPQPPPPPVIANPPPALQSRYTVTIRDFPSNYAVSQQLLHANADAVMKHLSQHISWNGVLDFVIRFDVNNSLGQYWRAGGPGFAAYGGFTTSGRSFAGEEAATGIDANGADYELGTWVSPSSLQLMSHGLPIAVETNPVPTQEVAILNQRDLFSVLLHEALHGLGMWSAAQHALKPTFFDTLTQFTNNQWVFAGVNTIRVYGAPLPLAATGSRDHYSDTIPHNHNLMREIGP